MNINELFKKLQERNINPNNRQIAEIWGMDEAAFSRKKKAGTAIKQKNIEQIEHKFDINLTLDDIVLIKNDCIDLPVRGEVTASMGTGVEVYDENKTGTYQLGRKLLRDIGANQQFSEIIFAQGDSMEPTIEGGDSLLIDLSKTEIYDGKIYCVRIENKLYAKRLQLIPPSKVKVISDNKEKYDAFYIDMSKSIDFDFAVIGEVKWWGRVAR